MLLDREVARTFLEVFDF